jgi:hypothetical protein
MRIEGTLRLSCEMRDLSAKRVGTIDDILGLQRPLGIFGRNRVQCQVTITMSFDPRRPIRCNKHRLATCTPLIAKH